MRCGRVCMIIFIFTSFRMAPFLYFHAFPPVQSFGYERWNLFEAAFGAVVFLAAYVIALRTHFTQVCAVSSQ